MQLFFCGSVLKLPITVGISISDLSYLRYVIMMLKNEKPDLAISYLLADISYFYYWLLSGNLPSLLYILLINGNASVAVSLVNRLV